MRLDAFLVADAATAIEGKLYVHGGGITRVTPPMLPWTHPQLALVLRFTIGSADVGSHKLTIRLVRPDGELVFDATSNMPVAEPDTIDQAEETYANVVLTVGLIQFEAEGVYRFELDLDGDQVGSLGLPLVVVPQAGVDVSSAEPEGQ